MLISFFEVKALQLLITVYHMVFNLKTKLLSSQFNFDEGLPSSSIAIDYCIV